MARAKRHHIPGQVWQITHRCTKRSFYSSLVGVERDSCKGCLRRKIRSKLQIINYTVASNSIRLLVIDGEREVIPKSLQLIAGKTAQEFDRRKGRKREFCSRDRRETRTKDARAEGAISTNGQPTLRRGEEGHLVKEVQAKVGGQSGW